MLTWLDATYLESFSAKTVTLLIKHTDDNGQWQLSKRFYPQKRGKELEKKPVSLYILFPTRETLLRREYGSLSQPIPYIADFPASQTP